MKIFVVGAYRPQFDTEAAKVAVNQVADAVKVEGYGLVCAPMMVEEWKVDSQLEEVRRFGEQADMLVLVFATFVGADMVMKIVDSINVPAIIWAVSEPSVGNGRLKLNSLCGAMMTNNALRFMSKEIPMIYGDPSLMESRNRFRKMIKAENIVAKLKNTVIGVVGNRPQGYFSSDYDELQIVKKFGARVKKIDLKTVFESSNAAAKAEVDDEYAKVEQQLSGLDKIAKESVMQSIRAELGLRSLIKEQGLTSVCVECWPDFMTEYGGAVCWALSRLVDDNIMAGCEADVYGTLTMIMQKELSGTSPFFSDLVHLVNEDRLVFWHCGAAPLSLSGESPRASVHPNRRVGLTVDFALKGGEVTVIRLHREASGDFSLIAIPGEAQDDSLYFSGNSLAVKTRTDPHKVLEKLLDIGAEHHLSVGYGIKLDDVQYLGHRLEIPVVVC